MVLSASITGAEAPRPASERDRAADGAVRATDATSATPRDKVTISAEARGRAAAGAGKLTADQQQQVTQLAQRDTHVRAHEAAHQAAGGSLTGGASFSYQVGPDGKSYAVGGEVPIRLVSGRTPDETIRVARQARAAALAPSDPSAADLSVAAAATQLEMSAARQKAALAGRAYQKVKGAARDGEEKAAPAEEPVARVARAA